MHHLSSAVTRLMYTSAHTYHRLWSSPKTSGFRWVTQTSPPPGRWRRRPSRYQQSQCRGTSPAISSTSRSTIPSISWTLYVRISSYDHVFDYYCSGKADCECCDLHPHYGTCPREHRTSASYLSSIYYPIYKILTLHCFYRLTSWSPTMEDRASRMLAWTICCPTLSTSTFGLSRLVGCSKLRKSCYISRSCPPHRWMCTHLQAQYTASVYNVFALLTPDLNIQM